MNTGIDRKDEFRPGRWFALDTPRACLLDWWRSLGARGRKFVCRVFCDVPKGGLHMTDTACCSLKRFALSVALALALFGGLFASVFVDLTVDPPDVVADDACVAYLGRDAQGISFALADAPDDLDFAFFGLSEGAPVAYRLFAADAELTAGEGATLPLADWPHADQVLFYSPDPTVDWRAVTSVQASAASVRVRPALPAVRAAAPAASASARRTVATRAAAVPATPAAQVPAGSRAVATATGFELRERGCWTQPEWGASNAPSAYLTTLSGFSGTYPNGEGAFSTGLSCSTYLVADQEYVFCVGADDSATLAIGGLGSSIIGGEHALRWGNTVTGQVSQTGFYPLSVSYHNVGGPYRLAFSGESFELFGAATLIPYADIIPDPARLTIYGPVPHPGTAQASVALTNADTRVDYALLVEEGPGSVAWDGTRWRYTVDCATLDPATDTNVVFRLVQTCGDAVWTNVTAEIALVYDPSLKPVEREDCACPENGTKVADGCVSFSQRFGTTPAVSAAPWGLLLIEEERPNAALATPAVLRYDHPMERRLVGTAAGEAIVTPPVGHPVFYRNGRPADASVTLDSRLLDVPGAPVPTVREVFRDRSEVVYTNGVPASLVTADGVPVAVADLGIEVVRGADGAIRQLWAASDGLLDVIPAAAGRFMIAWYPPAAVGAPDPATGLRTPVGSAAKTFSCGTPPDGTTGRAFSLVETRPPDLAFASRWDWSDAAQDWTLTRGDAETTVTRAIAFAANGTFTVTTRATSAAGLASETVSRYSTENGIALVSRTDGGRLQRMNARLPSGNGAGRPGASVDARGLVTETTYDAEGRPSSVVETGGPVTRRTVYTYAAGTETPDFTPVRTARYEDDVCVRIDTYERLGTSATGLCERTTVSDGATARTNLVYRYPAASGDLFAAGRLALEISHDGTAVTNTYAAAPGALYVETATHGLWTANGFTTEDGRSTRVRRTFDARGNVIHEATDALVGGVWRELEAADFTYSLIHQRLATVRSNGRTADAARICTGPLWTRDEEGIATTNAFDGVKRMVSSTRYGPFGAVTTAYALDAEGRVVSKTRSAPGLPTETTTTAYDLEGRVVARTDAMGNTTATAYSVDGLTTTVTYPDGGTRVTTLNADGSVASVTGSAVTPEYYSYGVTTNGLAWTCVRYGRADSPRYAKTYANGFGETVREERPGANGATLVTEYAYNAKGQLVSTVSTGRPAETRTYDAWGELVSVVHAADGTSRTVETATANALLDGEVWRVAMRTVACSDPAITPLVTTNRTQLSGLSLTNESRQVSVDVRGNARAAWSSFDPATSTRQTYSTIPTATNIALSEEVDGVRVRAVSHSAVTNAAAYDAYRRAVTRIDGRGNATTNAYDAAGRLESVADATGATTRYVYDAMGRTAAVTNALGVATVYEYDLKGNKTYEGGGTYPVTYAYDAYNTLTNMTTYRAEGSQNGDTTTWLYDEATGLLLAKTYADGHGPTYTYTDTGELATRTWARGVVTSYAYDGWNQLLSTTYSDDTPSVTYAYDVLGRPVSATDAAGTTTTAYDVYGDISSESVSGLYNKTLSRHRDAYGRAVGYTLDGSRKNIIEFESDTARLKRVMFAGAWYTYGYLPGTDLKASLAVGTAGRTDWTYEPNRDLLTQVKNTAFGSVVSQYDYVSDALGRRTEIARSGARMTESRSDVYGYNDRNELVSAGRDALVASAPEYEYSYDDIGNRLASLDLGDSRVYQANSLNQYTSIPNAASTAEAFIPQYDLDGNQTLVRTTTGDWTVSYNGENRPVQWSNGATNVVMKLDRMGRRVEYLETESIEESVVNDDITNIVMTVTTNAYHRFVYDGYLCIQRLNAAANNAIDLAFGWDPTEPAATRPLWMQRPAGSYNFFYFHDGNKNVSELVSYQSARGVPAHYEYAPFGAVTAATTNTSFTAFNVAETNPFRFSSEYADDALGLVYYNYRHYEPVMGRWLSRDPQSIRHNEHLYSYLANGQLSDNDCLGLISYKFDKSECLLKVSLRCEVAFVRLWDDPAWIDKDKTSWLWEAENTVENYYSRLHMKCSKLCDKCICMDDVRIRFDFILKVVKSELGPPSSSYDFKIWVVNNTTTASRTGVLEKWRVILNRGSANLTLKKAPKGSDNPDTWQAVIVHEVGHMLGLDHPGQKTTPKQPHNKPSDYEVKYDSVMGRGMKMEEDDFETAFCNHIQME